MKEEERWLVLYLWGVHSWGTSTLRSHSHTHSRKPGQASSPRSSAQSSALIQTVISCETWRTWEGLLFLSYQTDAGRTSLGFTRSHLFRASSYRRYRQGHKGVWNAGLALGCAKAGRRWCFRIRPPWKKTVRWQCARCAAADYCLCVLCGPSSISHMGH